jgi:hypothetical protein
MLKKYDNFINEDADDLYDDVRDRKVNKPASSPPKNSNIFNWAKEDEEEEESNNDSFEIKQEELISEFDNLYHLYNEFTKQISPKHWRISGTHLTEIREMMKEIPKFTEITAEEQKNVDKLYPKE